MTLHPHHVGNRQTIAEVYAEVQHFYTRHMYLLDSGAAQEWAETFTADGVFAPASAPEPIVGREALASGVRAAAARLRERGELRVKHRRVSRDDQP